jgi:hypothetical protein
MKKHTLCFICLSVIAVFVLGCGQPGPSTTSTTPPEDPRVAELKKSIAAKTTPESQATIEIVKAMKPELNGAPGGRTLGEEANASTTVTAIGWEATLKTAEDRRGRWKIVFHYRDSMKQVQAAEWEYDPVAKKVYPFDMKNAPTFWSAPPQEAKSAKGSKSSQ